MKLAVKKSAGLDVKNIEPDTNNMDNKNSTELETHSAELIVKNLGLDKRVKQIIDEEFAEFERYIPTLQGRRMYQRKRKEYWEKVSARIAEENNINGRTDETARRN